MSISRLNTLSLDDIRPILSYVDLISLIKLYATFNRKIQTLLSCPGAFAYLSIKAAGKDMPRAPYRYFVSSIRNVAYLKLENDVKWSPASISLLRTLNPRHLELGDNILHESVSLMLMDAVKSPENQDLHRMAQFFLVNGVPNFPILTPRMDTLALSALSFKSVGTGFQVPSTLTKLEAPPNFPLDRLLQMPPTLISLVLKSQYPLNMVLDRFIVLQHLSLPTHVDLDLSESVMWPDTLRTLQVASFDLQRAEIFSSRLPNCRLSIISTISVWRVPEHVRLATGHWLPHLNPKELYLGIIRFFEGCRVHFRCKNDTYSLLYSEKFVSETDASQIQLFRSQVVSVALSAPNISVSMDQLPPGLTSLSLETPHATLSSWPFNSLTHLDAPSVSFGWRHWSYLSSLTVLRATIVGLEDFNVVPFLTTLLSRKTRVNASITICTYITGALLHDKKVDGLEDATWELIQQKSESLLKCQLASPMPPSTSEDVTHIENDTIGRIVTSLRIKAPLLSRGSSRPIILPDCTTAIIKGGDGFSWHMASARTVETSQRHDGLRQGSPESNFACLPLPNRLVRLEMYSWVITRPITFPETLRYLIINYDCDRARSKLSITSWPSHLEVLMVWPSTHRIATLPVDSKLPSSLQHLALGNSFADASLKHLTLTSLHAYSQNNLSFMRDMATDRLKLCVVCTGEPDAQGHLLKLSDVKLAIDTLYNPADPSDPSKNLGSELDSLNIGGSTPPRSKVVRRPRQ